MGTETLIPLDKFQAPWGKEIDLKAVNYDSGLKMIRITIRERSRFTVIDLDLKTASNLANNLTIWINKVLEEKDQ